ncbi:Clp protease N-terminal domain-containing protein [Kitasatospora fiedleri]|uniref:Clp protease N-terminal domain-containing protein n=1 Tax=Kitasatospora fiedleri TaxID=2991545 RepID=UPI00249C7200|nr:Clp protease N-terminal domain-containing protein [Kitasatospora fiedleri]
MSSTPGASRRTVIDLAREDARHREHTQTDTGHLLLAVLAATDEPVVRALAERNVTAEQVRDAVVERWAVGVTDGKPWRLPVPDGELPPFSLLAGESVRRAAHAVGDGSADVRPVDLLAAMAAETDSRSLAATVLRALSAPVADR